MQFSEEKILFTELPPFLKRKNPRFDAFNEQLKKEPHVFFNNLFRKLSGKKR